MNSRIDVDSLPWNAEAEQSVLGGLLLDNRAFDAAGLSEHHYSDPQHATIWLTIATLITAFQPADVITVHAALRDAGHADACGGLEYLNQLAQCVPSAANVRRYAEIVREKAAQRALIDTADKALTIAGERGPVAQKLDKIVTNFARLQREQLRKVPRSLAEIAVERTEYYEALESGTMASGWRSGIPRLDQFLNGGLQPGRFYVLAARPSVGKSSFSQAVGLELAQSGKRVLFLSQEMSEGEVADRGVANIGRISYSALMEGKMGDGGWSRVLGAMDRLKQMPFFIDDQPALTLTDIRAKVTQIKPDVLILDYLQLCASTQSGNNRNSEIEEISRGLKALAKDMQVAVIALSQLNREVEKRVVKRPTLADLRDSGAIEQDADVVLFLWPVREFDQRRLIGCGVDKNRQGKLGEFGLDFHGDLQRWGESTDSVKSQPAEQRRRFE